MSLRLRLYAITVVTALAVALTGLAAHSQEHPGAQHTAVAQADEPDGLIWD